MRTRARAKILAALVAGVTPLGCQWIADLQHPSVSDAGVVDAFAPDTADVGPLPSLPPAACGARPPSRPDGGSTAVLPPIQLVFRYYDCATSPTATGEDLCPQSGFALDPECTDGSDANVDASTDADAGATPPCRQSCKGTPAADGSVDNAGGEFVTHLRGTLPVLLRAAGFDPVQSLEDAKTNLMIWIANYNGEADDPDVTVQLFSLTGAAPRSRPIVDGSVDGAPLDPTAWSDTWDRRSLREWTVDPNSVVNTSSMEAKAKQTCYVAQHVLVCRSSTLPFFFQSILVEIEQATMSGELRQGVDGHWTIVRGRVGGDVSLTKLHDGLQSRLTKKSPLCGNVDSFLTQLCEQADRGQPGHCDAVSVGLSFTMVEGLLGELKPPTVLPGEPCPVAECP